MLIEGLGEKKLPFNLFHKKKQTDQEKAATPPQKEPQLEAPAPVQTEASKEPISIKMKLGNTSDFNA